ncbi:MAG TPA: hypothetical protein EYQ54_21305 [Myxococcales bacterium]|jgi:uncharacterized protein YhhL (DUF1145 family)|nr:hypothetical protein [Myxococcales bacterium]
MDTAAKLGFARKIVLVVWVFAGASFFFPLYYTGVGSFGRTLFGLLLAVHLVEFFVFLGLYRRAGGSLFRHFHRTVVFGVLHKAETEQALADT